MTQPQVTRVAIVEDDERVLRSLSEAIALEPELELDGVARSIEEAERLFELPLDVVVLDLRLPDGCGLEWLEQARIRRFRAQVIVLSALAQASVVVRAIELGAAGYLEKGTQAGMLTEMIRCVLQGGAPLGPRVAAHVLARLRESTDPKTRAPNQLDLLSEREREVLRAIAKGLSFKEVARLHGISPHTVTAHVKSIYRKLAVSSRGEAVFEAHQAGLLADD